MFTKNLAVMLSAGLSITRALEILSRQTNNKYFSRTIISLMNDTRKGDFLSSAMKKFPKIFSKLFIAMVKTGEESGQLSESLNLAGGQLEKRLYVDEKSQRSDDVPGHYFNSHGFDRHFYVYLCRAHTGGHFQRIECGFASFHPSDYFHKRFCHETHLFVYNFFLGRYFSAGWFLRTEKGKIFLGKILLKTPLISPIIKKINSARTSRTLASLISSGVNVVEALSITRDVLQNNKYKEVLTRAMDDVQKGVPVSNSFKEAVKIYPVLLGEMMAVGEETGKMSEMLERLAVFYEEEVTEATKDMATVIEPILMIFIGAAVGFFALSMIKPMYSMMNGI